MTQAMKERVMAPKPGWVIRAHYGQGTLLGSLVAGLAASPEEAVARWAKLRGVTPSADIRAWPKSEARR